MSVLNSFLSSSALGIVLSFGIICFSPRLIKHFVPTSDAENAEYQEEKLVNSEEASRQEKKLGSLLGVSQNVLSKTLREELVVRKSKKLQRVLGITDSEVRDHIRKNNPEYEKSETEESTIKKTRKLQKVLGMNEHDVRQAVREKSPEKLSSISTPNYSIRDKNFHYEEPVNWFKILDGFVIFILLAVFCYFFNFSTNGDFGRVIVGLFPREFEALGLKEFLERMAPNDPRMVAGIATRLK